ncbi:MAG: contractile injection system tape measure protein, partial [Chitinophagales bacterium]
EQETMDGGRLTVDGQEKETMDGGRLTVDGQEQETMDEEKKPKTQKTNRKKSTKDSKEKEKEERRREWSLEDLLVYFLEYGLLPKRMPRRWRNSTFEGLFVELLEKSSKKTLPLLRKEMKANEAQERLIKQLSDKTLSQLLKVIVGTNAAFVEKFMAVVANLYASDSAVFKVESSRVLQWRSVIAYLVEGDTGFDRLGFLAFAIRYLSKMSSATAMELLEQVQAVVEKMEEADGVKVLKVSLQSLAKIAKVVFEEGKEENDKEVIEQESIRTPMAKELERIGLQLNEDDIFDMREVVNYLYGAKTQTAKYSKSEFERLFRALIETYPDTSKSTLKTLLRDREVLEKILKEFSDKTYQAIVALLQPSWAKRIEQYLKDLTVMFKAEVMRWELLWYLKDIDEFSFSLADFIHQVLNEVIDGDKEEYGRMLITTIKYLKMTKLTSKNDLREALSELKVKYDVRVGNIKPKGRKRQTSLDEKVKSKKTLLEETIYVHNAGLVLIYPFLSRYFNFLGMLEENKFKDETTANRAVLLLQYLATGFSKSPEHELVLNKLLCGLPLDTPVPSEIEMTDKEKEISGQMMQAIIQNWKRLNNMTINNFRGSFILRDGKLEETEKFWQLKIEKKAWDVLLKTLPWSYSMVRLPWMEKIINVEWEV